MIKTGKLLIDTGIYIVLNGLNKLTCRNESLILKDLLGLESLL